MKKKFDKFNFIWINGGLRELNIQKKNYFFFTELIRRNGHFFIQLKKFKFYLIF